MRGLIDVHAHPVTPDYLAAMRAAGLSDVDGFPIPGWSEGSHLELLDRHGITAAVLSFSAPGISFASGLQARQLARRLNEAAAERRVRTNGRLGAFAVLTLPDVDGALDEMAYALDELELDGIGLLTNIGGRYLGDPAFDAIFAEAERRGTVISTHPVAPDGYERFSVGYGAPALEYPFDTTRMLVNLVASGTLRRHPRLKLIASHGGGTIPFLAERIAGISPFFNRLDPPITPPEIIEQLRGIHYDCTAVANRVSLESYSAFVPAGRRLYGSDAPFMPEASIPPSLAALTAFYDEGDAAALCSGNAEALFPHLGGSTR
jgi:predicted TIM-barrel fold metal-dependent hydrolase